MPDREKVIKAWEIFRDSNPYEICDGREFRAIREPEYCMGQMIEDTIALLKEQEAVSAHWDDDTGHWIEGDRNGIDPHTRTTGEMIDTFRCSWCGFYQYWKTPFCPNCGAKMEGR